MSESVIVLSNISRVYHAGEVETHALADVSLEIGDGEFLSIEGPSGSGKSTLLAILGLLDQPSSGSFRLAGQAIERLSEEERARIRNRHIGFVFQEFNLIGTLSVEENVALPLRYAGMGRQERADRVADALQRVQLSHRARHYPNQLSGGQQQRAAVARAIVSRPSILLADEPTGNLDSSNGEAVMDLLRELNSSGTTVCMVTHDRHYAGYASRAIRLRDGRLEDDD